jgi:hypothetical protein
MASACGVNGSIAGPALVPVPVLMTVSPVLPVMTNERPSSENPDAVPMGVTTPRLARSVSVVTSRSWPGAIVPAASGAAADPTTTSGLRTAASSSSVLPFSMATPATIARPTSWVPESTSSLRSPAKVASSVPRLRRPALSSPEPAETAAMVTPSSVLSR